MRGLEIRLNVLGLARENSENAISDHLETPHFLKCTAFISAQLSFTTKSSPRKNNTLQSGCQLPASSYAFFRDNTLPLTTSDLYYAYQAIFTVHALLGTLHLETILQRFNVFFLLFIHYRVYQKKETFRNQAYC